MTRNLPTIVDSSRRREIAIKIANDIPETQRNELVVLIDRLLAIRNSEANSFQKLKSTLAETLSLKVIWPTLTIIYRQFKANIWDRSSPNGKVGMLGASVGLIFFWGQGAGIAAFGSAVAVPLWIVFGAGAMYANHLREALMERIHASKIPTIDL